MNDKTVLALGMIYGASIMYIYQAGKKLKIEDEYIKTLKKFNEFVKTVETK